MNPFDDTAGSFLVLVNAHGQHSLWPARRPVPEGWSRIHGEASKQACLDYVDTHWTAMTPAVGTG